MSRQLRIVRYHPRALVGDGGMSNSIRKWSRAMARQGAAVAVAYEAGDPPPSSDILEWRPVRHRQGSGVKVPVGLEEAFQGADLVVLHSGWTYHNAHAAEVARRLAIPYLLEPRGAYDPSILRRRPMAKRLWWTAIERKVVHRARGMHIFFEEERPHAAALGYAGPLVVASNGVDAAEGRCWDGGTGGYLLWLGRFDPEHKGLDLLLEAMRTIPSAGRPQLRLHGPDWRRRKREVERMIAALGLEQHVCVGPPAYGDEKRQLLTRAVGFAYPSRWDACPNAVLEAVSLGIPTVVTAYPLGSFLAARGAAMLADFTPQSLAKCIGRVHARQADDVGRVGAQLARTELTWDRVACDWLSQVRALL